MSNNERWVEVTKAICWTVAVSVIAISANSCSVAKAESLRVLMIDAGTPYQATTGKNISIPSVAKNKHFHSDAMYEFITYQNECKNVVVDWCVAFNRGVLDDKAYKKCLSKLNNYDLVNMSIAGEITEKYEIDLIYKTTRPTIVIAAGNLGIGRHLSYPAKMSYIKSNVVAVSAVDLFGVRLPSSNWDTNSIDYLGIGCYTARDKTVSCLQGTSVAAAYYTNKLIKGRCPK